MKTELTRYSSVETMGKKECTSHPDCPQKSLGLQCTRAFTKVTINEPGMKPDSWTTHYKVMQHAIDDHDRQVVRARRAIAKNSPTSIEMTIPE